VILFPLEKKNYLNLEIVALKPRRIMNIVPNVDGDFEKQNVQNGGTQTWNYITEDRKTQRTGCRGKSEPMTFWITLG
jgi:hypothetical protein